MHPDRSLVERQHLPVLMAPWIRPAVVRIRKATDACLISVVNRRCPRPCHLHDDRLAHHLRAHIFARRIAAKMLHTSDVMIRTRQKAGMIVIRKLIHSHLQGRPEEGCHMIHHCSFEAVRIAKKYFSTIGLEVYPMNADEYAMLREAGADFVTVFQETYDLQRYGEMHVAGAKRCFPYRVNAQERALMGGMRGVGFGVLLGLADFRKDMFAAGVHAALLQKKYPQGEMALSFPRLRPYKNHEETNPNDVHETQLLQMMLACRIFLPFASFTISTRERADFRDHVLPLAATKISAGVNVGIGGHNEEHQQKGDAQFEISDPRSLEEIHNAILAQGMQPVYTDYINTNIL